MGDFRINIIGASGSGKTTLAKALAARLGIPHFDADDYYHFPTDPPFQKQRSPQERQSLVMRDLGPLPSWVLSGAVGAWEPEPILDYTHIFLLYLPPEVRLARLRQREQRLYGKRIEAGGDMEEDHKLFIQWTAGYDLGTSEGTNTLRHHR